MANIFISYRRSDSASIVGRICDRLNTYYGSDNVFFDIDDLPYGVDFRRHVDETLSKSDVVVAVIGRHWRGAGSERTIAAGVPLVPVLLDGARMPAASQVPESLKPLVYINFLREITPKLNALSLSEIAEATCLSLAACSRFRAGTRVPHPRHWDALVELVNR